MVSVVVGLGNIGRRYHKTRHNIGFMVLEKLINKYRLTLLTEHQAFAHAELPRSGPPISLILPTEYMNNSGNAASALLQMKGLSPETMLVVVDDFNLPLGTIRIRRGGSDGGHNGLASIIEQLETDQFPRLRLGIGPLPEQADVVDFVLDNFADKELEVVETMITRAVEAVEYLFEHDLEEAMSRYNERNPA